MDITTYVAETLFAEKQARLEEQLKRDRWAKQDAPRRRKKRAFAFTLFHLEVTVRTVRRTANS